MIAACSASFDSLQFPCDKMPSDRKTKLMVVLCRFFEGVERPWMATAK